MNTPTLPYGLDRRLRSRRLSTPGKRREEKFPPFFPRNPLISLDSDERIQGNPSFSNPRNRGSSTETPRRQENPNMSRVTNLSAPCRTRPRLFQPCNCPGGDVGKPDYPRPHPEPLAKRACRRVIQKATPVVRVGAFFETRLRRSSERGPREAWGYQTIGMGRPRGRSSPRVGCGGLLLMRLDRRRLDQG